MAGENLLKLYFRGLDLSEVDFSKHVEFLPLLDCSEFQLLCE